LADLAAVNFSKPAGVKGREQSVWLESQPQHFAGFNVCPFEMLPKPRE